MNVLIVDDDPLLSRLLERSLQIRGHTVTCCENGAEAVLAYEGRWTQFDAVVSDVHMPQLDGISLCRAIRDQLGKPELPVLLMSSLDGEEDILRGLEAGADDYVVKPFRPSYLAGKLESLKIRREPLPASLTQELPLFDRVEEPKLPLAFDQYVLEELIGEGGFSWVYGGRRPGDGTSVAVKILKPDQLVDRSTLARYFREVAILGNLDCPHIVTVLASGYSDGHFFLVMERLRGETAYQRLQEGPLSCAEVVRIGLAVSLALTTLAEGGLLHRDVKPTNVMLGSEGAVTLIDLGLAKAESDQELTLPTELMGTTDYLAPEVIRGSLESIGSDCYALGVTLYELLTNAKPFGKGKKPIEILRRVASGAPVPPAKELRSSVPEELSQLLARLMHPAPEERLVDPAEAALAFSSLTSSAWMLEA